MQMWKFNQEIEIQLQLISYRILNWVSKWAAAAGHRMPELLANSLVLIASVNAVTSGSGETDFRLESRHQLLESPRRK